MADIKQYKKIIGREIHGDHQAQMAKKVIGEANPLYFALTTTLANAQTDAAVTGMTGGANFFADVIRGQILEIHTDQELTLKLGTAAFTAKGVANADLPGIKLRANTTRHIDFIADITGIFITNASGSTANIDMIFA